MTLFSGILLPRSSPGASLWPRGARGARQGRELRPKSFGMRLDLPSHSTPAPSKLIPPAFRASSKQPSHGKGRPVITEAPTVPAPCPSSQSWVSKGMRRILHPPWVIPARKSPRRAGTSISPRAGPPQNLGGSLAMPPGGACSSRGAEAGTARPAISPARWLMESCDCHSRSPKCN